jgi:hypothetical protein
MQSKTTRGFWKCFDAMPHDIQELATKAYRLWRENPAHPGLRFKMVHSTLPIYSIRISGGFRAVGVRAADDMIVWYWIGTHAEYERIIRGP